ncbi:ATP-binding protein [Methylobacterium sp. Leaf108]|uniref:ATP-binding protein n=1 Tax=Methylobacterium sp. Leaf108 TaxID=1736256 RepID=UPI000700F921|nr:ATP-binding protein [Methylobacterium sp. Leaf108]KQP61227.1 histidine kinase [Methylobacterium sp. Leaf108]
MTDEPGFLAGGGRAAQMIRARDWSGHPLGAPHAWPEALQVALSLVLNSPESMILCWGEDLHFFFNETYFPLLGPRLSWAMGSTFAEVWADGWEQAKPIIAEAMAGRSRRFVDLPWTLDTDRGAKETWWTFSYSRVLDADGAVAGLFIFTNETTGRVLADAALAESQRRLETALAEVRSLNESLERRVEERTAERDHLWESSEDLLAYADFEGRILRVSPSWVRTFGHDAEILVTTPYMQLVHPDDVAAVAGCLAHLEKDRQPVRYVNRLRHADGSWRSIAWSLVPEPGRDRFNAVGRDVTAELEAEASRQRLEDQLRQSQKLEAVGQLTGGVAHDFNNLLTIIRSSVDLLRRPSLPEDRRARYLDAVSDTVDRAAKLTGQLLAFARRQTLKPQVFEVGERLRSVAEMLDTLIGARIRLTIETPERPCFVEADLNQFETALVNMTVNARDAMDGIGTLVIRLSSQGDIPSVRSPATGKGPFAAVSLTDTGSGIPEDRICRIFEPFFTTKEVGKGTGLGLSQVFGFTRQSGGDIAVESVPGAGTTFTLYLPEVASASPAALAAPIEEASPMGGGGRRILVVEDNVEVGRFATQVLEDLGYRTILAAHAEAALDILGTDGAGFDAVFSDVVMPGMGGIALARLLAERLPGLPVVLASGYSHVLAQEGAQDVVLLHKPYSADQLGRILRSVAVRAPGEMGG